MVNHAKFPELNILTARAIMDEFYPIELDEDTFLERAMYAWKKIGNIHSYIHVYEIEIPTNGIVTIPDNVESIETVTSNDNFYNSVINEYDSIFYYVNGSLLKNTIDVEKPVFQDERYNRVGAFVNYELHGSNILHFDKDLAGSAICIVYQGVISDEDCNPLINFKEAEAIAYQVAFVESSRRAYAGDPAAAKMVQFAKGQADNAMSAATIPEKINENLMDQVLNIKSSFDRKTYNNNYKFRK